MSSLRGCGAWRSRSRVETKDKHVVVCCVRGFFNPSFFGRGCSVLLPLCVCMCACAVSVYFCGMDRHTAEETRRCFPPALPRLPPSTTTSSSSLLPPTPLVCLFISPLPSTQGYIATSPPSLLENKTPSLPPPSAPQPPLLLQGIITARLADW